MELKIGTVKCRLSRLGRTEICAMTPAPKVTNRPTSAGTHPKPMTSPTRPEWTTSGPAHPPSGRVGGSFALNFLAMWESLYEPTRLAAIAALFSFITSLLVWRIQQHTFRDSIRPQLDPIGWDRSTQGAGTPGERATVSFQGVANSGRGAASDTSIYIDPLDPQNRYHMAVVQRVPLIPANDQMALPVSIIVWFQNTTQETVTIPLWFSCYDSHRNRHSVSFEVTVLRAGAGFSGFTVAHNVAVVRSVKRTQGAKELWLRRQGRKLWLRFDPNLFKRLFKRG